jgi:hypothetical protein
VPCSEGRPTPAESSSRFRISRAIAGQITNQTGKSAYVGVLKGSQALVLIRGVTASTATVPSTDTLISLARQALERI